MVDLRAKAGLSCLFTLSSDYVIAGREEKVNKGQKKKKTKAVWAVWAVWAVSHAALAKARVLRPPRVRRHSPHRRTNTTAMALVVADVDPLAVGRDDGNVDAAESNDSRRVSVNEESPETHLEEANDSVSALRSLVSSLMTRRLLNEALGVTASPSWQLRRRRFARRRSRGQSRGEDDVDAGLDEAIGQGNEGWTSNLVWAACNLGRQSAQGTLPGTIGSSARTGGRRLGMGLLGHLLGRELLPPNGVGGNLAPRINDFRPYLTYWLCIVHAIIFVLAALTSQWSPFGLGTVLSSPDELVRTERLTMERVDVVRQANFWLGLETHELIRLGAKFTPCMRPTDPLIDTRILERQRNESLNSGCCIRNDGSGCLQTQAQECSPLLSTFAKWSWSAPGPDNRVSGPVCGQDPRFCNTPASVGVNTWPDDISKWPICFDHYKYTEYDGVPRHASCRPTGRPCCVGIHGRCELRSQEFCDWVNGRFHQEATLCSQVDCMSDVCGSGVFNPKHQMSRLISALFLHAGLLHLLLVIAFQVLFLLDLERLCGTARMALIYFGSGITGNLASAIFVPYRAECGPSGALFGVMAAQVMEVYRARSLLLRPWFDALQILLAVVLLILVGVVPWVDNYAHFFGLVQGLLLSYAFIPSVNEEEAYSVESEERKKQLEALTKSRLIKKCAALILSLLLFGALLLVFYLGLFADCAFCRLLSCFPFTRDFCREQNIDYEHKQILF